MKWTDVFDPDCKAKSFKTDGKLMHMARGNAKYAFWSVQQELKELFFLGNFLTRGKWHCRAANISRRLTGWDCHISSWKQKKNAMLAVKEKDLCRGETFINTEKKRLYILRLSFCISSVAITGQKALRDSNLIHPFSLRVNEFSNHHSPFLSYLVQIITREFHCCLNLSSFSMICALTKNAFEPTVSLEARGQVKASKWGTILPLLSVEAQEKYRY